MCNHSIVKASSEQMVVTKEEEEEEEEEEEGDMKLKMVMGSFRGH